MKNAMHTITCPACNKDNHTWKEAYFSDAASLHKIEKTFISWCSESMKYVISSHNIDAIELQAFENTDLESFVSL